jgi:predicted CxxxxCH...CXXCH cytochrome family protein
VHPIGWAQKEEASFHGNFLRSEGYPLAECQSCHGEDFLGGDVGVSCSDSGACHAQGVESCAGTCHGDSTGPLPSTGAHKTHAAYCTTCHPTPTHLQPPHVDGTVDLQLVQLAASAGFEPQYNADTKTCTNTYCHAGDSPPWTSPTKLSCDGCHVQSPTHDRFDRVVDESTCGDCHGGSPETGHLDGALLISVTACNACHGQSPATGAPPVGLDGSTDTSHPGVGAHRRHMDSLLPGRMGKVVACRRCHAVPAEVLTPGHLDSSAPADVTLAFGSYDSMSGSCVVDCHFDRDPGPVWSDDSGAERACDACHGFPPVLTRTGTPHPLTAPNQGLCLECHQFSASTHVDGEVTFQ